MMDSSPDEDQAANTQSALEISNDRNSSIVANDDSHDSYAGIENSASPPVSIEPLDSTITQEPNQCSHTVDSGTQTQQFAGRHHCNSTNHVDVVQSSLFSDTSAIQMSSNDGLDHECRNANGPSSSPTTQPIAESSLITTSSFTSSTDNNRWTKERNSTNTGCDEIGATYIDERAPNINLRFYRGLARRREQAMSENNARRQRSHDSEGNFSDSLPSRNSAPAGVVVTSMRYFRSGLGSLRSSGNAQTNSLRESVNQNCSTADGKELISATLVEEEGPLEVAVAEKMSFCHLHWKLFVIGTLISISKSVSCMFCCI
jgi:hypothetical protein